MTNTAGVICVVMVRSEGTDIFNLPQRFPTYPQMNDQISLQFGGQSYFLLVKGRIFNNPGTPDENVVLLCETH